MPLLSGIHPDIVCYVDIQDICPDGVINDPSYVNDVVEKFRSAGVDALLIPFMNFGCERAVAGVTSALRLTTLVVGARDE